MIIKTMRRIFIILVCCFAVLYGKAQGVCDDRSSFTTLDWNELHIDSMLPTYSEVVPLETDYRDFDYSVTLEYPTFVPLTAREAKVAQQFDSLLSSDIQVHTHVGVMRRMGMLDIAFVPIVKKGGKYQKLTSARIAITATPRPTAQRARAAANGRYAEHSRLAEGRWVKIQITDDGMYRLTRQALKNMGFARPENVHLYGYGGHRQAEKITATSHYDDLPEQPLYYNKERDCWLFWGNGLVHWEGNNRVFNPYARAATYFLHEEDAPCRIDTLATPSGTPWSTLTTTTDHVLYERDQFAWVAHGRNLYDGTNFSGNSQQTFQLQTLSSQGEESLEIAFTANAKSTTTLTPKVNGQTLSSMTLSVPGKYEAATANKKTYDVRALQNDNKWSITLASTAGHDAHLDYIALHYKRLLTPAKGFVAFGTTSSKMLTRFTIKGSALKVMRIGSPSASGALLQGQQSGDAYSVVTDTPSERFVAFDPSYDFPQPTLAGTVQPQDLHACDSVDMLIIIPESGKLRDQANRLSQAHKAYDGLSCLVVNAGQIFNEFSSGTPDATAYRRFLKMLYDRGTSTYGGPRYLLLMGDCMWDNRMLTNGLRTQSPSDYLLCYESDNSLSGTKSYVMEDYFALLDDGEGGDLLKDKPDVGVGRFPVTTSDQARVMVDKTLAFMANESPGPWRNVVCMMGDDGDNNEHMVMSDDVATRIQAAQPSLELRKVMWDYYDRVSTSNSNTYPQVTSLLRRQMKEGAAVMNYTGHGNATSFSHEFVLNMEDFANNKTQNLGLWITAACDIAPFDGETDNSGETAVLTEGGGALAFYGTARTVYASQNLQMNRHFMRYLFERNSAGQRFRVGDAVRLAKNAIISGGSESIYGENKLQYALLGDPALVIGAPDYQVVIDSINGQAVGGGAQQLKAGARATFSGRINDRKGALQTDFSGVLSMRVYDNEELRTCRNNARADNVFTFTDRTLIHVGQDSIRQGRFSTSFVVPMDINYSSETGRLVLYAVDNKHQREANGHCHALQFSGISETAKSDTIGPKMYLYLNDDSFQSGGTVNSTPCLIAHLQDESGISISGNGVGHDIELCVDGRADMIFTLNDYYVGEFGNFRQGTVAYTLPSLDDGKHWLTLRAWDVLNNTSQSRLDFVVDATQRPDILRIGTTQNPAATATTFIVTANRPGTDCQLCIEVFDFMGRRMWAYESTVNTTSGIYTIPWNLCTDGGSRLGTGIYLYRCSLQSGGSKRSTKTQKIVVINNK